MPKSNRTAFTLIEVLIVVVIMAILAAVIVPQFTASTDDAKESAMRFNTHTLRSQVELYRGHHGEYPDPLSELTQVSDQGYGPYIDEIPPEPFSGSAEVTNVTADPITASDVDGNGGWLYNSKTGEIRANNERAFE